MTIISHSKKFIFIHPQKCAGSSITIALKDYNDEFEFKNINKPNLHNALVPRPTTYTSKRKRTSVTKSNLHHSITDLIDDNIITEEQYEDYYKFSIVRNPWDRFVSRLSSKKRYRKYLNKNNIIKPIKDINELSIRQVVDCITYYGNRVEHIDFDYVIKLENIQSDFNKVCKDLDIDGITLEHKNISKFRNKKINYTEYYDNVTRKLIKDLFKDDIEMFGYKFGD